MGQRSRHDLGDLFGRIGCRTTAAGSVLQRGEAVGVEPMDGLAHGLGITVPSCRDRGRHLAPAGGPDPVGALDHSGRGGPRVGELFKGRSFLCRQLP